MPLLVPMLALAAALAASVPQRLALPPPQPADAPAFYLTRPLPGSRRAQSEPDRSASLRLSPTPGGPARSEAFLRRLTDELWPGGDGDRLAGQAGTAPDPLDPVRWHAVLLAAMAGSTAGPDSTTGALEEWLASRAAELARPDLLRAVRRSCPLPLPASLARCLARIRPGPLTLEAPWVRLLATAPGPVAREILTADLAGILAGRERPARLAPLALGLARIEDPELLPLLYRCRSVPTGEPAGAAIQAYRSLLANLRQARRFAVTARALGEITRETPDDPEPALDRAECLIWSDVDAGAAALRGIIGRFRGRPSSRAFWAVTEARLGLALVDHLRGLEPRAAVEQVLAATRSRPRSDRESHSLEARALMLLGLDQLHRGDPSGARESLARAVAVAPYRPEQNLIDRALWGRFGPIRLLETAWLEHDGADAILRAARAIERALREDPLQRFMGPDGQLLRTGSDERPLTWLPTFIARVLDDRLGTPQAAITYLEPIARELESSNLYANRELLVAVRSALGQAAHSRRDAPRALEEFDRGIRSAKELQHAVLIDEIERRERRLHEYGVRPPLPDPGTLDNPSATWLDPTVMALHLNRAAVLATLSGDHAAAVREIRMAHSLAPADPDVRLAIALAEAREAHGSQVERLLACVEPTASRLYNLACVQALRGQPAKAVTLLREHVQQNIKSAGARRMFRSYARQDPDLVSLRDDPGFEALLADD